jgi:uncharacterized membrane protein YbaN (DUF454 family)
MHDTGALSLYPDEGCMDPAPCREPSLVHANSRRLRVHLPHWSCTYPDVLAAAIERLPGVTWVEANPLTGNVRMDFEPQQTSMQALLDALPAIRLAPAPRLAPLSSDVDTVVKTEAVQAQEGSPDGYVYVTGPWRAIYQGLGWASVGMAVVGAILPGIPTAPFVILAGYFFIRSSRKAHEWLRQARVFGPMLRDWEAHRGVRRATRNVALGLIGGSMVVTLYLGLSLPLTVTIVTCQIAGMALVMRLRVIDPTPEPLPAPA